MCVPRCLLLLPPHLLCQIAFSPRHPVLIVGDEKGSVHCFKVSPNLRKALAEGTTPEKEVRATRSRHPRSMHG